MDYQYVFYILLPIVAFIYAAVGHGGASGYLAMMAIFAFPPEVMKPTGLLLNLFVAGISFYHYWRNGNFNWKLFLVFALGSIPMAFVGGLLEIDAHWYKVILGILLLFAVLKMLNIFGGESNETRQIKWGEGTIVGAVIGFFSGLIGIGGGIILSPVILLMKWGDMKTAAAVSALFIWVNSASGLVGQMSTGVTFDKDIWIYVALAVFGGFLGGYVGSKKMENKALRYLLAFVLILASIKLIFT